MNERLNLMFYRLIISEHTSISSLGKSRIVHLFYFRADLHTDLFLQWQVKSDDLLVQLRVEYESLGELGRQLRPAVPDRLPLPPLAVRNDSVSTIDLLMENYGALRILLAISVLTGLHLSWQNWTFT